MYRINETNNINEATYDYEDWVSIRDAQTFGDDVKFPNNTVTAIPGYIVNKMIAVGELDISECSFKEPLTDSVYYVFRRSLKGNLVPLHVSMMPDTAANILRGSRKFGSLSIENEGF